jgi:TrmH family RNA methyltransferase
MITSVQNQKIKWVRSLQNSARERRSSSAFVVEGVRMAEETLEHSLQPRMVLYTQDFEERFPALLGKFNAPGIKPELVAPHVMKSASDTQTPQGILVVLPRIPKPLPDPLTFVLVPDSMRDPGNLGNILRSAAAAGVDAVFVPPESVDPYSPKVVRAAMGAHFYLSLVPMGWEEIAQHLDTLPVYGASAHEGIPYYHLKMIPPLALIIGGETSGLSAAAQSLTSKYANIPMPGRIESLNAAAAAGILLFEVVRQGQSSN